MYGREKTPTPKDNKKKVLTFIDIRNIDFSYYYHWLMGWQTDHESIDNIRLERMIARGDIENCDNEAKEQAQIYIRASQSMPILLIKAFERSKSGPHYFIEIGDIATFSQELKTLKSKRLVEYHRKTAEENTKSKNFKRIVVVTDNLKSWGWEIIGWILPFLLIFGLFYWSMRVWEEPEAAGGQIFNIENRKHSFTIKQSASCYF